MPIEVTRSLACLLTLTALTLPAECPAQSSEKDDARRRIEALAQKSRADQTQGICQSFEPAVAESCRAYNVARFKAEAELAGIRVKVFQWQIMASNVVLMLVVLLTCAGVALAAYQLLWSQRCSARDLAQSEAEDLRNSKTNLEFSSSGVKIQSSIVGITVLGIACLFVIAFLNTVYRIEVVPGRAVDSVRAGAAATE
ncbi:hypothetical protein [Methylobacterium tardum]|uniref:hypothetical protein n=1 Tax=Methylobacterium tardum TaxID=374432 RepID=UPI001EE068B6|nr:hypothetical protein [Methylobacterium tardum]URD36029.1 hypothetical protein M6G65_26945 [Methylobacterium tardum]